MLDTNATIEFLLPYITGTVARVLGNRHSADVSDVANDTVIALLTGGLERHEGRASLKAYAMTSAKNRALKFKRFHRNHGHASVNGTDADSDDGETVVGTILQDTDGRHTVERSAQESGLEFALECLLEGEESEFMRALLAGETNEDAAKSVGWSPAKGTRQRKKLTAYLAEWLASGKWEE